MPLLTLLISHHTHPPPSKRPNRRRFRMVDMFFRPAWWWWRCITEYEIAWVLFLKRENEIFVNIYHLSVTNPLPANAHNNKDPFPMSVSTVQRDRAPNRHVQVGQPTQPLCRSNSPPPPITTKTTSNSVSYAQQQLGVSLSEGLKKAYNECKAKVERIAAQCKAKNRKFRYESLSKACIYPTQTFS